jgi:cell division protein FtsQ
LASKKKNKKRKAAYRRGEKMALFFKRGTVVLMAVVICAAVVLGLKTLARQFGVKEIMVSGNYHLDADDIMKTMKIHKGESLLKLHFENIEADLKKNQWIKKVAFRKQYPGTLVVKIAEAEPRALLSMKKRFYLIDEDGAILERIEEGTIPFLPLIKDIDPKNKKGMKEALKLVAALSGNDEFIDRESIEIGLESYGLAVHIDGEFIKVGYGKYEDKFERWIELEPEIRKRGVPIKYVDLRFKDSVIVKPLKERKGEKTS